MIRSSLSGAGAAVLLVAGIQEPERRSDPDLRNEIHEAINAEGKRERDTALDALRRNAADDHEILIRELLSFLRESTSTREGTAFASIRRALSIPDEHIIRALVPLFESADASMNAALSGGLSEFEVDATSGKPDFTAYVPFLTGQAPPGLLRHMRAIDQNATSRALAAARKSGEPEQSSPGERQ